MSRCVSKLSRKSIFPGNSRFLQSPVFGQTRCMAHPESVHCKPIASEKITTMTTERSTKKSSLTVFIMRHGERLDEALHRSGHRIPPEIRVDPPLTAKGHLQAQEAFAQLNDALLNDGKKRKITVAVSPAKRTIGTSLMACTSGLRRNEVLDWAFTSQDTENVIPMVVINGLSACASAIQKMGGAEPAIANGHLPCADVHDNTEESKTSPIAVELQKMQQTCQGLVHSQDKTRLDLVQYWKIQRGTSCLMSMTPPLGPTKFYPSSTSSSDSARTIVPRHCGQLGNETFLEALDRAVLLAGSENCDTLIVVAHREAVRDLADRWGTNGFDLPRRLNYCCIASYKVKIYEDRSCRWCFHGVADYQHFGIDNVPNKERWKRRHDAAATRQNRNKDEPMLMSD